jgi:hypothetical protein
MTGETWTLAFQCKGAPREKEFITVNIDRDDISFYNLLCMKSKFGYADRDYLYYKKRCGRDIANLEMIDYEDQALSMIETNENEMKVRLVLSRDEPREQQVTITPLKRSRDQPNTDQSATDPPIDAYKVWLHNLQSDEPDTG